MSLTVLAWFFFAGCERIIPFEMVLKGRFQGTCQYWEVPLVDTLPPAVNVDRDLALAGSRVASPLGSIPSTDRVLVDVPIGGASRNDRFPSDHEEEPLTELVTRDRRSTSKRRLAWLDFSLTEGADVNSSI